MKDQALASSEHKQSPQDTLYHASALLHLVKHPHVAQHGGGALDHIDALISASTTQSDAFASRMLFNAIKMMQTTGNFNEINLPSDIANVRQFLLWQAASQSLSSTAVNPDSEDSRYLRASLTPGALADLINRDHLLDLARAVVYAQSNYSDQGTTLKDSAPQHLRYHVAALLGLRANGRRVTTDHLDSKYFLKIAGIHDDNALRAAHATVDAVNEWSRAKGGVPITVDGTRLNELVRQAFNEHCPSHYLELHGAATAAMDMFTERGDTPQEKARKILDLVRQTYFPDTTMEQVRTVFVDGFTKLTAKPAAEPGAKPA